MSRAERPRLLIAATQSGSGKTTITSGIIAALAARGLRVHPYKVGPDYIDPGYLGLAAGGRADNLDTWLTGEAAMKKIFLSASEEADISIIEGVMGLYDGGRGGVSSTARIAKALGAPVLLVIDVRSMGESAAAIAKGFRDYDPEVDIRGVIINRYGSENHRAMCAEAIERAGLPVLGAVPRNKEAEVKERHLGLLPVEENSNREHIENIRKMIEPAVDLEALLKIAASAPSIAPEAAAAPRSEKKVKIAVARDEAFSFYYPESVAVLEAAGAEIIGFSPLNDEKIPDCHGLIFGGGFPEIFAARLAANASMKESIARAAAADMPIYAECGGFMYLTREIKDFDGAAHRMCGVIPMSCKMNDSLRTVGYVTAKALSDNVVAKKGEELRGHEFHFSSAEPDGEIPRAFLFTKNRTGEKYPGGWADKNILGSYLHLHFAGFPKAAERFVEKCKEFRDNA
ncbi:cobyrinate a,c-diamide synthase [Cloacibacillus evryensis]|uniref:cobyrinate a,c-diamide synthase n=1 Tax=Cloacibacillus evryensis TaxID=508460 RepID=UPI003AB76E41